jgi:hypothetical protein
MISAFYGRKFNHGQKAKLLAVFWQLGTATIAASFIFWQRFGSCFVALSFVRPNLLKPLFYKARSV